MSHQHFASNDMSTSFSYCLRHYLRHTSRVFVLVLVLSILVNATPHFLSDDDLDDETSIELPDKRIARLSYFRSPSGGSHRRRYESNGYGSGYYAGYGKYGKKAVSRYKMPWENLPNTNCLRKSCSSDDDCCRRYNKCNVQARICYDCWYGHPCNSNRDCCEKFPYCNPMLHTCSK
ncbi:hypothetical protein Btru_030751 [Bulinus truncatus]|nr:hypothetical protein Btru_030751 [Bulinus truncatus]